VFSYRGLATFIFTGWAKQLLLGFVRGDAKELAKTLWSGRQRAAHMDALSGAFEAALNVMEKRPRFKVFRSSKCRPLE